MNKKADPAVSAAVPRRLFWTAVVILLVGVKLLVTFFAPRLRAPGEPLLGGLLLLLSTAQLFLLYSDVRRGGVSSNRR